MLGTARLHFRIDDPETVETLPVAGFSNHRMAYTHTYHHGLGLDVASLIERGGPAILAASKVVEDPALPEVGCHLLRLNKAARGLPVGPPCASAIYPKRGLGVGLSRAVKPLRALVWARTHPITSSAMVSGAVGLLVLLGYYIGRRRQ